MAEKYQPPKGAAGNARKVIEWREKHGDEVKGMTRTGWVRARQLASGKPVSADIVKRMAAFNRHRKNAKVNPEYKATPWKDKGYVAWLGWGGDTGVNWAIETSKRMDKPKAIHEPKANNMEITIYGDVVTGMADEVRQALGDGPVTVRINSDGGSVREGLAIYNMLKDHPHQVTTVVEGGAFSIAAYIALAGDRRIISENGMMMVHGARTETFGNLQQHEQTLEMLKTADAAMRKAFVNTTGKTEDEVVAMMSIDTWLDADQALAEGLVTEITNEQPLRVEAFSDYILAKMPPRLVAKLNRKENGMQTKTPASYKQLKAINSDNEFIVAMLEVEATEDEAKEANAKAMEEKAEMADALAEENEELKAQLQAMEEKIAAMEMEPKAEEKEAEATYEKPAAEEEEKKMPVAKGVAPVANVTGNQTATAKERWLAAIDAEQAKGRNRATAVRNANRNNPGLRAAYLNEIN